MGQSVKNNIDKEKKYISENALNITKYYNEQLDDLVNEIQKETEYSKKLTKQRALKIEYLIKTFNTLFNEWGIKEKTKISLNLFQVLTAIASIKYPENIEIKVDEKTNEWKDSLAIALKPIVEDLIKVKEIEKLEDEFVKYFSLMNFQNKEIKITFEKKSFVECTFSKEFLINNNFKNCEFINCNFFIDEINKEDKRDEKLKELIKNSDFKGDKTIFKFKEVEFNFCCEALDYIDERLNSSYNNIIKDARDNIVINSYIVGNTHYKYKIEDNIGYSKIKEFLFENSKNIDSNINKNNSIISISKNYIDDSNKGEYEENSLYTGWHSLFKDRFEKETKDYYIFGIKNKEDCYFIVFKNKELEKYLNNKTVDRSGKYNFYFSAIVVDSINEKTRN